MSLAVGRALDATAFALATAAGIAVGYVAILVKRRRVSSDDEVSKSQNPSRRGSAF